MMAMSSRWKTRPMMLLMLVELFVLLLVEWSSADLEANNRDHKAKAQVCLTFYRCQDSDKRYVL